MSDYRDEPGADADEWKVAFGRCAAALAARLHEIRRLRHDNAELEKALQRARERIALLEREARRLPFPKSSSCVL